MGDQKHSLYMQNISKAFPGVQALSDVTFDVCFGEIHALVGENGAGKSTLMKILSGAYQPDNGSIVIDGEPIEINMPSDALSFGIVTIYQETNLAMPLTVAENIFMGRMPRTGPFIRWKELFSQTQDLLTQLGATFKAQDLVRDLSTAQRQMVEIAKALSMDSKIIILDEPTASLTESEVDILFSIMRQLKSQGVSLVFISHRLGEVLSIADRVTVLRDGFWVSTDEADLINEESVVRNMVGRELSDLYARERKETEVKEMLVVKNISGRKFHNISFEVNAGEIVGLFGLVGSGRTDVVRAIFGAEEIYEGVLELEGKEISPKSPKDAINAGIALAPEDRKVQGLILDMSVKNNVSLPSITELTNYGFILARAEKALADEYKDKLAVRCPSVETISESLSGGNQQKVVIAKWLAKTPKVLILDEPTRGIDVGGKAEVHNLMSNLANEGVAVLMVSSELPEILGMSDRVLIMHEKRLVAEVDGKQATGEEVMAYATGQKEQLG